MDAGKGVEFHLQSDKGGKENTACILLEPDEESVKGQESPRIPKGCGKGLHFQIGSHQLYPTPQGGRKFQLITGLSK